MLNLIKDLLTEKVQLKLIIRGAWMKDASVPLQRLIVSYRVPGVMNIEATKVEIIVEGPHSRLERLVRAILHAPFMPNSTQSRTQWSKYEGRYKDFRVAFCSVWS
jgi:acylphosphatase